MLPDRVSNPGPLTYESSALLIALRGPAIEASGNNPRCPTILGEAEKGGEEGYPEVQFGRSQQGQIAA